MKQKTKTITSKSNTGTLSGTRIYTFELMMSIIGLLVTAFVVDYGIFSIFRHLSKTVGLQQDFSEFIIFIIAAMIVWLPVAVIFYLRTRGEMLAASAVAESRLHKVLTSLYMFINIIAAIGALFYAVYMLLQFAVGTADETVNSILRYVVPGFLMVFWHGWLFFAYSSSRRASRRIFALVICIVTIVVVVALFILTASGIRAQAMDEKKESDASSISQEISRYQGINKNLPKSLKEVEAKNLNFDQKTYTYQKVSDERYKLCADFAELGSSSYYGARNDSFSISNDDYRYTPSWSDHEKGEYCYKIQVTGTSYSYPKIQNELIAP